MGDKNEESGGDEAPKAGVESRYFTE